MKEEKIILNDSFEILEKQLFGSRFYHQDAGVKTFPEWKSRIVKIAEALCLAIDQNLNHTDKLHRETIVTQIKALIKDIEKAPNIDLINNETIVHLTKIVFLLLGDFPNNWDRRIRTAPKKWYLNRFRTSSYLQTPRKKSLLLIETIKNQYQKRITGEKLQEKLRLEMNGDYKLFNNWYKEEQWEEYYRIFKK